MSRTCIMATDKQSEFFINREIEHPTAKNVILNDDVFAKTKAVVSKGDDDKYHLSLEFFDVPRNIYDDGKRLQSASGDRLFVKYVVTEEQLQKFCRDEEHGKQAYQMLTLLKNNNNVVMRFGPEEKPCGFACIAAESPLFSEVFAPKEYANFDVSKYVNRFSSILEDTDSRRSRGSIQPIRVAYDLSKTPLEVPVEVPTDKDDVERISRLTGVMPDELGFYREGFKFTAMVACDEFDITQVDNAARLRHNRSRDLVTNPYIYNYKSNDSIRHDIIISPVEAADLIEFSRSKLNEQTGVRTGVLNTVVTICPKRSAGSVKYNGAELFKADDIHVLYNRNSMYFTGDDIKKVNPRLIDFAYINSNLNVQGALQRPPQDGMKHVLIPDKFSAERYGIGVPGTEFDRERHDTFVKMSNRHAHRQLTNEVARNNRERQNDFAAFPDDDVPFF